MRGANRRDRRDILDHADLIVHVHHRYQHRIGAQCRLHLRRIDTAVAVRREVAHRPAAPLQFAAGIQYRLVLGAHGDEVTATIAVVMRHAPKR
jgi:hypothetical protein